MEQAPHLATTMRTGESAEGFVWAVGVVLPLPHRVCLNNNNISKRWMKSVWETQNVWGMEEKDFQVWNVWPTLGTTSSEADGNSRVKSQTMDRRLLTSQFMYKLENWKKLHQKEEIIFFFPILTVPYTLVPTRSNFGTPGYFFPSATSCDLDIQRCPNALVDVLFFL